MKHMKYSSWLMEREEKTEIPSLARKNKSINRILKKPTGQKYSLCTLYMFLNPIPTCKIYDMVSNPFSSATNMKKGHIQQQRPH